MSDLSTVFTGHPREPAQDLPMKLNATTIKTLTSEGKPDHAHWDEDPESGEGSWRRERVCVPRPSWGATAFEHGLPNGAQTHEAQRHCPWVSVLFFATGQPSLCGGRRANSQKKGANSLEFMHLDEALDRLGVRKFPR